MRGRCSRKRIRMIFSPHCKRPENEIIKWHCEISLKRTKTISCRVTVRKMGNATALIKLKNLSLKRSIAESTPYLIWYVLYKIRISRMNYFSCSFHPFVICSIPFRLFCTNQSKFVTFSLLDNCSFNNYCRISKWFCCSANQLHC